MRLPAATTLFFKFATALLIVPVFACPALAQSVHKVRPSITLLPIIPSHHLIAIKPGLSQDSDLPRAGAHHGLSPRQRKVWLLLGLTQHGAAFFDARTTRDAMTHYQELDPALRPFAHSAALYPIMQIAPLGLDWLAIRMATSRHRWVRRIWWLPQTAAAAGFLWSGTHNLSLPTPSAH